MTAEIILGKKHVTRDSMPYIIAEIGVNHEGKLSQALELIDLARKAATLSFVNVETIFILIFPAENS